MKQSLAGFERVGSERRRKRCRKGAQLVEDLMARPGEKKK